MKKYRVTGSVSTEVDLIIEAESESDAYREAYEKVEDAAGSGSFGVDLEVEELSDE